MKNVFRLFGRFTMVMMIVGMVTLTSCEKEDVFDGKKPTEQVLGGGDEIGNPEDFYPYTDKIIVESVMEFTGEGYVNVEIMEVYNEEGVVLEKRDTLQRRSIVFKGKKITTDTITVGHSIGYRPRKNDYKDSDRLKVDIYVVFFKDGERLSKEYSLKDGGVVNVFQSRGIFKSILNDIFNNL